MSIPTFRQDDSYGFGKMYGQLQSAKYFSGPPNDPFDPFAKATYPDLSSHQSGNINRFDGLGLPQFRGRGLMDLPF